MRDQVAHLSFLFFLRFVVGQHVEQHRLHFVARGQAFAVLAGAIALTAQVTIIMLGWPLAVHRQALALKLRWRRLCSGNSSFSLSQVFRP
ncbi:hypothetical protein D3C75_1228350 [compost metagenome]